MMSFPKEYDETVKELKKLYIAKTLTIPKIVDKLQERYSMVKLRKHQKDQREEQVELGLISMTLPNLPIAQANVGQRQQGYSAMTHILYYARFAELNKYLESFPLYKEGHKEGQNLPDDEVLEFLEFAIPSSWQKQRFYTLEHTKEEIVEFCERIEFSEDIYDFSHVSQKATTRTGVKSTGSKQGAGKQVKPP